MDSQGCRGTIKGEYMKTIRLLYGLLLVGSLSFFASCTKQEKTGGGVVVGAGTGALIGSLATKSAVGGVVGAVAGGALGGVIGNSMGDDK
jgi:hypothetical protein